MKKSIRIVSLTLVFLLSAACIDPLDGDNDYNTDYDTASYQWINLFSYNVLSDYYLWVDEVKSILSTWNVNAEPVNQFNSTLYPDDKWTQLTDSFDEFTSSVSGVSKTTGADFTLYYADEDKKYVCAVVNFVYADSPASKSGLKRGDTIVGIEGSTLTAENYYNLIVDNFYGDNLFHYSLSDGTSGSMTPVVMYEDPLVYSCTYDVEGKKIGYLFYTGFTLESCQGLVQVCKEFKNQGIEDLILDLRYNGGGYVLTEDLLASMLAPQSAVQNSEIFTTEVYNEKLNEYLGRDTTRFCTSFEMTSLSGEKITLDTKDANIGIDNLYAIMTGSSASASEAILVGLKPYMNVEIIGEQSHGKYCSGIMIGAQEWYDDVKKSLTDKQYENACKYIDNWGIYVMIGRYADKYGMTPCMPYGFSPDYSVSDNPFDGYEIGDVRESMLCTALNVACGTLTKAAGGASSTRMERTEKQTPKLCRGVLIQQEVPGSKEF